MSGILNKNCGFIQKLAIYHITQYYLSYYLFENLFEKKPCSLAPDPPDVLPDFHSD